MTREQRSQIIAKIYGGEWLSYNVPQKLELIAKDLCDGMTVTDDYVMLHIEEIAGKVWRINKTQPRVDALQKAIVCYYTEKGYFE